MVTPRPHICFVAPAAWPVVSGDQSIETAGGSEVQQSILARAFVMRGYRVTMICMDYGQPEGLEIDGIRMLKMHTPDGGLPVIRFVYPRLTSIWAAMKRADADIYYQRSCSVHTGYVGAFCQRYRRKFIYAAASDGDFDPTRPLIAYARDKAIYAWGLRRCDAVIAQNAAQMDRCRAVYNLEAVHIRSCYAPPENCRADINGYVLWVSSLRTLKRPEMFIELARRLPKYHFRMVGGADQPEYFDTLCRLSTGILNLEMIGFVPYAAIDREFDGARLFVNTSAIEGFPNTFLQSWARCIPTVSFVDPGSLVNGQSVVNRVTTLEEMGDVVEKLMNNDVLWQETGSRCGVCYRSDHSVEAVTNDYEVLINNLYAARG